MTGGLGNDIFVVDNVADVATETSNSGIDTVRSSVSYLLGSNIEDLILIGSDPISGSGNSLRNSITGNTGNNTLDGGTGADSMDGGLGDDTYVVDNAGDMVTEVSNAGSDTVRSSISYNLSSNLENLVLTGSASINGSGNSLDNIITGNAGNNVLNGGIGSDILDGGAGNDTYFVDTTSDSIIDSSGIDAVIASISWTLIPSLENLTLQGSDAITGTGNSTNNRIIGNSGNNLIDGKGGSDILTGGDGSDTFAFTTKSVFGSLNATHITDFQVTKDSLQISKSAFGISADSANTITTVSNLSQLNAAMGSSSSFVYDISNGNLYWNQDGTKSGFGAGGIFAILDNRSSLSSSNISLI